MLIVAAFIFTVLVLSDPISILLFFVYTFIFAAIFFALKFRLYSMKTQEEMESRYTEAGEEYSKRYFLVLLLILIFALFLPFLLLMFLDPLSWFSSITGFIAGVNIPEVVLYLCFKRTKSERSQT